MSSDMPTAHSVPQAEWLAAQTGDTITIPNPPARPPERYERSPLSLPMGQQAAYRTPGPKEHYQLRVYEDRWTVEQDSFHPKHYPVQHAAIDAPMATAVVLTAFGAYFG